MDSLVYLFDFALSLSAPKLLCIGIIILLSVLKNQIMIVGCDLLF